MLFYTSVTGDRMRHIVVVLVIVRLLFTGDLFAQPKTSPPATQWNSFDVGMEQARTTHKKVLVDVYTEWCGWCKKWTVRFIQILLLLTISQRMLSSSK